MKTRKQALESALLEMALVAGCNAGHASFFKKKYPARIPIDYRDFFIQSRDSFRIMRRHMSPADWKAIIANAKRGAREILEMREAH
jgi:hypothetical protein